MTEITKIIHSNIEKFTPSQKVVANFIIDNMEEVAFNTLEDLASIIKVSTTTIIRFARTLEYTGFSDMQKDIQHAVKNKESLPTRANHLVQIPKDQLLNNIFLSEIQNINNTLSLQNETDLHESVRLITKAKKVYVLGMRSSFSLASYTVSRLGQIKKNVHLIQSGGMMFPEEVTSATTGDVCIAFLFPRYSKNTATLISWLKEKGVKIILFTSPDNTIVKGYGDIVLSCAVSNVTLKNSFSAPVCLINYLFTSILQENYDEASELLKDTEAILAQGYFLGL
ncbi:MurR/RpiR family transcriptional regulator [Psychrobacillus lasiicapitis]|uniref:MurR/RpiR family transcriptional regulator n=1 Tax=Psychrobacillus lasiicapitis TaxID=1636719 RepID=A0A544TGM4_9BACI|nr:MurR/RpiR family transcriptional regulator [Psychrobacillus lasiicapitis]TQR16623.1 MurR/RpiR family transcriptional regulator [Psychrobacillus lasiicapitis]GGA28607.1 RpiR family transcriptional regulator [Psychrobacillus lasiicapitis]